MCLAFNLHKNEKLRENKLPQPLAVVSLLELLEINSAEFVKASMMLAGLHASLYTLRKNNIATTSSSNLDLFDRFGLATLPEELRTLELPVSSIAAERLAALLKNPLASADEVECRTRDLITRLNDELDARLFLTIPTSVVHYYGLPGTILGAEIVHKWSSLTKDAAEAGNCFALGRYTACVFHLMRVMERLVQEFLLNIKAEVTHKGKPIELEYAEWHEVEDAIAAKLKNMARGKRKSRCNGALLTLGAVRLGIRNEVMHPRGFYDDADARKLIDNVKAFAHEIVTLSAS
jgi:hypothetical protein